VIRCGNNYGLRVKCPVCGQTPPKQHAGEALWYGHRRWRWLGNHMVSVHMRDAALTHRRIEAEQRRIDARQK